MVPFPVSITTQHQHHLQTSWSSAVIAVYQLGDVMVMIVA
jgi:hypothetical protein